MKKQIIAFMLILLMLFASSCSNQNRLNAGNDAAVDASNPGNDDNEIVNNNTDNDGNETGDNQGTEAPDDEAPDYSMIPVMNIIYVLNSAEYSMPVTTGSASWSVLNVDGTGGGLEVCGLHPLDCIGIMPEIMKTSGLETIEITFDTAPESCSVRRWTDDYAGVESAFEQFYEIVNIENGIIALPDDGKGYIYEINASWPDGNAIYAFYVTAE